MNQFLRQLAVLTIILFIISGCSPKETPRPAPKALFNWSNTGEGVIQFSDQSTGADSYEWNFGDGSTVDKDKNPKHTFEKNDRYTVVLTVINPAGSDKATNIIEVLSFIAPTPDFIMTAGADGLITFANTSANAQTYNWAFGDGTTSTLQSPTNKYLENKKHTVTLTAIGKGGAVKVNKEIEITNVKPIADFIWTESNGQVTFSNKSKNADSYSWDFGNGKNSSEMNPTSRYLKTGSYTVKLIAKGKGGETTKAVAVSISYVVLTLTDVVDDQSLVNYLSGIWGAYVRGAGEKFDSYTYGFFKQNNIMKYANYFNPYQYLNSSETTKLDYKFSITDKVIYTETSNGKQEKYARFQIVSEDEMKLFRIFETSTSYSEALPFILTRTSDVEKPMSSVVDSKRLLDVLKGVWDQGSYSIYTNVAFDFSFGKNYYNYNSTFQEAKSIQKNECKVDANNIMSYRRWNSDFDPSWKKFKVEIISNTSIKLYNVDASGKIGGSPQYTLTKRD